MSDVKWFCLRCRVYHDVIDGIVEHCAIPTKPLTKEQMLESIRWANEHPIEISVK